ncbi:MAG TPA: hypothetical protein VEL28_18130 [Candidatus Binatia bacterium]|nr:hypothetical protein [Candidatus Binatia bacterium]
MRNILDRKRAAAVVIAALTAGCFQWSNSLTPIQPEHGAMLSETMPTLSWEPLDEKADEVLYDLAIFNMAGAVVYQADRLDQTSHRVTKPLPSGRYRWTVRALSRRGTEWTSTEWSARRDLLFVGLYAQWGSGAYIFDIAPDAQ